MNTNKEKAYSAKSIHGQVFTILTDGFVVFHPTKLNPRGGIGLSSETPYLFPIEAKTEGISKIAIRARQKASQAKFKAYCNKSIESINYDKYL